MSMNADEAMAGRRAANVPDYRAFRMSAEWATAVRGRDLQFEYSTGTGRMMLSDKIGPHPVVTPVNATRPKVDFVEMSFGGKVLRLSPDRYSALFWGESAVEKFLFSYYASASSDNAVHFLGRLFNAWYGYPGRVVQVCALAFRYGRGSERGELSLDSTVALVCQPRNGAAPEIVGLDEFERRYATGGQRGPEPIRDDGDAERFSGWQVGRTIDSIVMREAAEFLSGMRGRYVWLTLIDGELTPWVCPTEAPGSPPEGVWIADGVTAAVRPDRPPPQEVALVVEGDRYPVVSRGDDPADVGDCVFWTDGAVESLLLPYYASVKGWLAPFFTTLLMGKWNGLILPDCNDRECAVTALRGMFPSQGGASDEGPGPSTVYAVTHLPRSEYVSDGIPPTMGGLEYRTRLLTRDGGSGFTDHPLFGSRPAHAAAPPAA